MATTRLRKGVWYKLSSGSCHSGYGWYMKYDKTINTLLWCSEYVGPNGGHIRTNANFGNRSVFNYTKVDPNMYYKFLPAGHPDIVVKDINQIIKEILS